MNALRIGSQVASYCYTGFRIYRYFQDFRTTSENINLSCWQKIYKVGISTVYTLGETYYLWGSSPIANSLTLLSWKWNQIKIFQPNQNGV